MVRGLLRSLRVHQWVKNVFVFAAICFAGRLLDTGALSRVVLAFIAFCLLSSSVYLVNDVLDRHRDREHPVKRKRPIASGALPVWLALVTAVLLVAGGVALCAWLSPWLLAVGLVYAAFSYAYSLALKHVVILDVMILAFGYTLRAVAGAVVIDVEISHWLLICSLLLALFLGFCKRRQELTSLDSDAATHRAVLASYSERFLDQMIAVVTASTVISYLLYAFDPRVAAKLGTPYLGMTTPFVLYGIFRYFYMVHQRGEGGRPTREVLTDLPLLVNVVLYGIAVVVILYVI